MTLQRKTLRHLENSEMPHLSGFHELSAGEKESLGETAAAWGNTSLRFGQAELKTVTFPGGMLSRFPSVTSRPGSGIFVRGALGYLIWR